MSRVLIAMSGGVDSSVTAYLLREQGYDCMGATMRLYNNDTIGEHKHATCCSEDDVWDARNVANRLGMPYYVFNFMDTFDEQVIQRFVCAYECGRTPNPCIDCNRYLKFERLYHRARELECDYIATGHYARIEHNEKTGRWELKKALDESKDQSYVLYAMTQEQLAHTLFPLGALHKPEVRQIAEEQQFLNARKHDSQDICFVPDGDYAAFLRRYSGKDYPSGAFLDTKGNVLGEHKGIVHYTVGQRRGLGVSSSERLYVQKTSVADNTVTLCTRDGLFAKGLIADQLNLISYAKLDGPTRVTARIRYHQSEQDAVVTQLDDDTIRVDFDQPQRAIAPGQAVVLYQGDTVVGGATIREAVDHCE